MSSRYVVEVGGLNSSPTMKSTHDSLAEARGAFLAAVKQEGGTSADIQALMMNLLMERLQGRTERLVEMPLATGTVSVHTTITEKGEKS